MENKRKIFFGRIAVGKSTVAKKISISNQMSLIDCDKEIWNYFKGDKDETKNIIRSAIKNKNKQLYKEELIKLSNLVDWKQLLSKYSNYEMSVFGNYYNLNLLPKDIIDSFELFKIMCYVDTRALNIADRGLNLEWVEQLDYIYEDPKDIKYNIIFNEDILGLRKK